MTAAADVILRQLGLMDYQHSWQAMKNFTDARTADTCDELWCLQHPPVFTQGQAGKAEHILAAGDIPVVQVDRGGQVTYHGPGQLIIYLLVDLRRKNLGVRALVDCIEQSIIATLAHYGITSNADPKAPGVYVSGKKIASLGLRVRRGCSYHGLAFNVDMNTEPFARINPCGYAGLPITQLRELASQNISLPVVRDVLVAELCARLGYNRPHIETRLPLVEAHD